MVAASNALGFELLRSIGDFDRNLVFSPLGLHRALSMLLPGARGQTKAALERVLCNGSDDAHAAAADPSPASLNLSADECKFDIATGVWLASDCRVHEAYLSAVARHEDAIAQRIDFAAHPESARRLINDWVALRTRQRIRNLLPESSVDDLTRLIITNTVYFKAPWAQPFSLGDTRRELFHADGGTDVSTPMMHLRKITRYAANEKLQMLSLSYTSYEHEMVIVVPRPEVTLAAALEQADHQWAMQEMTPVDADVSLPRCDFRASPDVKTVLNDMELDVLFDAARCDLGAIADEMLFVSLLLHQATICIDEAGTEASAATLIEVERGATMGPREEYPIITFRADRPFAFFIRHRATGLITFMGRVVNPAQ